MTGVTSNSYFATRSQIVSPSINIITFVPTLASPIYNNSLYLVI